MVSDFMSYFDYLKNEFCFSRCQMIKVIRYQNRSGNKKYVIIIFSHDLWMQNLQFQHRKLNLSSKVHNDLIIHVKTSNVSFQSQLD